MSGDNIYVASTTDSQEQVEQAADYNPEAPVAERSHVTITSSDSPAEVDQASYGYRGEAHDAVDGRFTQQAAEKPLPVQSTTDPEEVQREESAKLREHQEITGKDPATGRPRGAEKRIAQLTREKMEARAEAEALRAQLHSQYQPQQQQQQYQPQPQYAAQQPQQLAQQQYQPQQVLEEYRAAQSRVAEEEKVFVERHPDYIESVRRLEPGRETPIPPTAYLHTVMNLENPADVAYYLSKSPETLAKLWSLEASGQGVKIIEELNHISSGLRFQGNTAQTGAGAAARRERQANSGPLAPIRPVGGSSMSSSTSGYSEGMSMRDYNAWRDQGGGGGRGRR